MDGAYGGPFVLTERGRRALQGIEAADSITVDPHKGLFVPHGTGALLVRERDDLLRAHSGDEPHYLQDMVSMEAVPSFADLSPELTRDFRGLRVWLPLHLHGVGAFRDALDEKLDLARHAYDQLLRDPRARAAVGARPVDRGVPPPRRRRGVAPAARAWSTRRAGCSCRAPWSTGGSCCGSA